MNLSIHRHRVRKDRRPVDPPIDEDCGGIACDRIQDGRAIDSRKANIVALVCNFLLLIIRADKRFARNTETFREFRFARALVGIFHRHVEVPFATCRKSAKDKSESWKLNKV